MFKKQKTETAQQQKPTSNGMRWGVGFDGPIAYTKRDIATVQATRNSAEAMLEMLKNNRTQATAPVMSAWTALQTVIWACDDFLRDRVT